MTSNINGIDVSECEYINCCNEEAKCIILQGYFKQLKRLQEENEKQKEQIKQLEDFIKSDGEIDHINHEYTYKLQKENEELKENQCYPEACGHIATEIIRYSNVCEINLKYKSALEEIKNITEKLITEQPEYHSCYYKDECGDNCTPKKQSKVEYCCYENVDKILTIIIEVLDEIK